MSSLQKVLISNASFSLSTGLIFLFQYNNTASLFGVENASFFLYLGIVLIFFSCTVFFEVKKQRKKFVHLIIIQDVIWVLASAFILLFPVFQLSTIAQYIILLIAFVVGIFAILQYRWSRTLI